MSPLPQCYAGVPSLGYSSEVDRPVFWNLFNFSFFPFRSPAPQYQTLEEVCCTNLQSNYAKSLDPPIPKCYSTLSLLPPTLRVLTKCIYPGRRATFSLRRKMKKLKCLFFTINEMSDCSNFFFYFCFRLNTKEYDLTWMYTEGREMAVFTDQQFEFALMKMRGMVDYEFLVKLRPVHLRMENQEADDS